MKYILGKADIGTNEGLPLSVHMRDSAEIAKLVLKEWVPDSVITASCIPKNIFDKISVFCAYTHDIGKVTANFMDCILKEFPQIRLLIGNEGYNTRLPQTSTKISHAWLGEHIIAKLHPELADLAAIVGAHHGIPYEGGRENLIDTHPANFYGWNATEEQIEKYQKTWEGIIQNGLKVAGITPLDKITDIPLQALSEVASVVIISDWLASNPEYTPLYPINECSMLQDDVSVKRAQVAWAMANFPSRWVSGTCEMTDENFKERFGFLPNELQKEMIKVIANASNPGLLLSEALPAIGKTEGALACAEELAFRNKCSGTAVFLPNQATTNGMFSRFCNWSGKTSEDNKCSIRLAHGNANLNEEYNNYKRQNGADLTVHSWFQGNKKALLADFVLGTIDQILLSVLKKKHFMLRHFGLAGKVVIIDECHAYDAYMDKYLERALTWLGLYQTPVILLSATLPTAKRKAFICAYLKGLMYRTGVKPDIKDDSWVKTKEYPVLTWTDGMSVQQKAVPYNGKKKKVKIKHLKSIMGIAPLLKEKLSDGGCAGIIVNTVRVAQDLYDCLLEEMGEEYTILLYHSYYTTSMRYKKETLIMKRLGKHSEGKRDKVILIGTQVLEQSLDYDVDLMITQLCPGDLFVQRVGRLHRHSRQRPVKLKKPVCYIVHDEDDLYDKGTQYIYGDYLLLKTAKCLDNTFLFPDDIPNLVENVYSDSKEAEGYMEYKNIIRTKKEKANVYLMRNPDPRLGGIHNIISSADITNERYAEASVRDTVDTIEVILMQECEGGITFTDPDKQHISLSENKLINDTQGFAIAKEKIRLPMSATYHKGDMEMLINMLEEENASRFLQWKQNVWIKGDLLMVLNKDGEKTITYPDGRTILIRYDAERGLSVQR